MLAPDGLYGHIRRNTVKSVVLLLGFIVLVGAFWYAWCLIYSAIWWTPKLPRKVGIEPRVYAHLWHALEIALWRWWVPVLASFSWFCIAFAFHASMIRLATRARSVERRDEPVLYNLVENLAMTAGLPMPRIEIMPTKALNAYAAGLSPDDAVIAVTRGLLNTLDKDELEAVLAHEMTHIRNRDIRLMVVASVFAGGLTIVGDTVRGWMQAGSSSDGGSGVGYVLGNMLSGGGSSSSGGEGAGAGDAKEAIIAAAIAIAIAVIGLCLVHLFAILTQFAISRSREFLADAGAAELTKNPDALVSALQKISGHDDIPGVPDRLAAMMISAAAGDFFSTHPDVERRIEALRRHAGAMATKPRRRGRAVGSSSASGAWSTAAEAAAPQGAQVAMGFGRRRVAPRSGLDRRLCK